ncbi:hypothetical protein VTK56DRAFT_5539 [Thermocarpiscus australiensis]
MLLYGTGNRPEINGQDAKKVYAVVGSGTPADPTVGWLFDVEENNEITRDMRREHVEVARKVAIRNGFHCILIRKEAHSQQYSYTAAGARRTRPNRSGKMRPITVDADPHITVYMGANTRTVFVSGHIYVIHVLDPVSKKIVMRQMDDPARQRVIVYPGYERVAEEFWLTRDTIGHELRP